MNDGNYEHITNKNRIHRCKIQIVAMKNNTVIDYENYRCNYYTVLVFAAVGKYYKIHTVSQKTVPLYGFRAFLTPSV